VRRDLDQVLPGRRSHPPRVEVGDRAEAGMSISPGRRGGGRTTPLRRPVYPTTATAWRARVMPGGPEPTTGSTATSPPATWGSRCSPRTAGAGRSPSAIGRRTARAISCVSRAGLSPRRCCLPVRPRSRPKRPAPRRLRGTPRSGAAPAFRRSGPRVRTSAASPTSRSSGSDLEGHVRPRALLDRRVRGRPAAPRRHRARGERFARVHRGRRGRRRLSVDRVVGTAGRRLRPPVRGRGEPGLPGSIDDLHGRGHLARAPERRSRLRLGHVLLGLGARSGLRRQPRRLARLGPSHSEHPGLVGNGQITRREVVSAGAVHCPSDVGCRWLAWLTQPPSAFRMKSVPNPRKRPTRIPELATTFNPNARLTPSSSMTT
jgi:hypothetical protein